jgi:hypothetical protein
LLQLEFQGRAVFVTAIRARLLSGSQDGFCYRSRLSCLGLDEQEFLFDADAARTHLSDLALGSRFQPQQFIPSRALPITVAVNGARRRAWAGIAAGTAPCPASAPRA